MFPPLVAPSTQALIFDMDGTMFDNMMVHHKAWQIKLEELGLRMSLEEVKRDVHGINEEILKRLFGSRFTPAEMRQIAWEKEAAYREIYADKIKLLPGLQTFLDQALELGIPMGIGTAAPKENALFALKALRLEPYFTTVIYSDLVSLGKPHPQVYELVGKGLGVDPGTSLIFEDSPTGAQAAANTGAASVILTTTHDREEFKDIQGVTHFMQDFTGINIRKGHLGYEIFA